MAVDKLVDSAQLNADLASVANAIRTKGGTSADLAFPAGFVSAVEAIPSGESDPGDWTNASKHMGSFSFNNLVLPYPETITLDASSILESGKVWLFPANWSNELGYRTIIINNKNHRKFSLQEVFMNYYPKRTSPVKVIFRDGHIVSNVSNAMYRIGYNSNSPFPAFYGEIDLSLLTDNINHNFYIVVSHIEFVPNTCSLTAQLNFVHSGSSLDNSSLISIANVLKDGIAGTVTFNTAAETNIQAIVGRNDTSDGYNKFVDDPTGTLTLTDFITTVKGWTLSFAE